MSYLKERTSENFRYIDFSKFSDKNFAQISLRTLILNTLKIKNFEVSENLRFSGIQKFYLIFEVFGNCNYTKFSSKKIKNLYSSNKPGFIEKFNKWVDEKNLLKGGLQK